MVTSVPPRRAGPETGVMAKGAGLATYLKSTSLKSKSTPLLDTSTGTEVTLP
jgi:hypothetical protein